MEFGCVTYNNLMDKSDDLNIKIGKEQSKVEKNRNFLSLATQIREKFGNGNSQNMNGNIN